MYVNFNKAVNSYTVKLHYNGLGYNRYSVNYKLFSGPGWVSINFNVWQYV